MKIITRPETLTLLYDCVSELNEMLPASSRLALSEDTVLLAEVGGLDSLGIVNFISAIEDKVQERYGMTITLTAAADTPPDRDPWRNLGTLTDFVLGQIQLSRA